MLMREFKQLRQHRIQRSIQRVQSWSETRPRARSNLPRCKQEHTHTHTHSMSRIKPAEHHFVKDKPSLSPPPLPLSVHPRVAADSAFLCSLSSFSEAAARLLFSGREDASCTSTQLLLSAAWRRRCTFNPLIRPQPAQAGSQADEGSSRDTEAKSSR